MATWIAHMRIAEHFMLNNENLNNHEFLVGNIGPDCGVPNDDWSSFTPDKRVTHWMLGDGNVIAAEDFRSKYLSGCRDERFPFYFGYYFHLLTDIEWSKLYNRKRLEPAYLNGLEENSGFIRTIKKDWYGQDRLYLQSNPDCVFYTTPVLKPKILKFLRIEKSLNPDISDAQKSFN